MPGGGLTPGAKLKILKTRFPFRFRKSLSQHFLHDPAVLDRLVEALGAGKDDLVVEIGAGAGFLTERLLATGARVIAIEIDGRMVRMLEHVIGFSPRLRIVEGDVLSLDIAKLLNKEGAKECLVAANLPYHITSPALFHLLQGGRGERLPVARMVLCVQKEVGDRMTASPGSKRYGALSVAISHFGACEKLFEIGPGAFVPVPKVRSMVLRLIPSGRRVEPEVEQFLFRAIRLAFGQRRKTLANTLARASNGKERAMSLLGRAGIEPSRRGETLRLEDFEKLARAWMAGEDGGKGTQKS